MSLDSNDFDWEKLEKIKILIDKIWWTQNELCKTLLLTPEKVTIDDIRNLYLSLWKLIRFRWLKLFYKDTVALHQWRLLRVVEYCFHILWLVFPDFDHQFARALAYNHDDIEAFSIFWDIPGPLKETLTLEERKLIDEIETAIMNKVTEHMLTSLWPNYNELLTEWTNKTKLESKLVSYVDKVDWFIHAFHEVCAWNRDFIEPFVNYMKTFRSFKEWKYPELFKLFNLTKEEYYSYLEWFFEDEGLVQLRYPIIHYFDIDYILEQWERLEELLKNWKPHTFSSIYYDDFDLPAYKFRKYLRFRLPPAAINEWESPLSLLTTKIKR